MGQELATLSPMLRATGYPLILLAMFSIAGGHWAVLQSMAWTGMLIEYSKGSDLGSAVSKTFGGKAPCKLCKAIEAGKQKETRVPPTIKQDIKIGKFLAGPAIAAPAPAGKDFDFRAIGNIKYAGFSPAPPYPVPRQA
jgi:hypothetical protein